MAKSEVVWPLDGVYGKNFRTTSSFGWRTHPITKTKKHHNGEDLVGQKLIRAIAGGTVIKAQASGVKKSNGEPGGYGYYIVIRHLIDGVFYTSLYAHTKKNSMLVKKGSKVQAGQVIAEMGTTGASTGIHLHLEIWRGRVNGWSNDGSGYADPIAFIKAHVAKGSVTSAISRPSVDADAKSAYAPITKPKYEEALSRGDGDKGQEVAYLQKALGVPVNGVSVLLLKLPWFRSRRSKKA